MNQKRPPDLQPARDALSSAPKPRQRRPSRSDRQTAQRWALGGVSAFGLAALFTLAGCPANLDQPERFAGGGGADPNPLPACLTAMFGHKCAGNICHDKGTLTNDLDLVSAGVKARILDVPAAHSGLGAPGMSCMPAKLVDTQNGLKSWIYIKLASMQGDQTTCGLAMPETGSLDDSEKACYTAYFQSLAGSAGGSGGTVATGGGGSGGAATGAGGSGGAATGGGGSGGAATTGGSGGSGGASGGASGSAGTGGA